MAICRPSGENARLCAVCNDSPLRTNRTAASSGANTASPSGEPVGIRQNLHNAAADFPSGENAVQAMEQGLIVPAEFDALMEKMARLLASAGFASTYPRGTHFLLTLSPDGVLARDPDGTAAVRLCNFEFLRKLG